ncbi:MAG: glycosyltransferase [Bacteroidales bacterium]
MRKIKKKCLITNFAPHYRKAIYQLMDQQLGCDFVFGNNGGDIKKLDYSLLKNNVEEVRYSRVGSFIWQKDIIKYVFKPYSHIILIGEFTCLSKWTILFLSKLLRKKIILWGHGWKGVGSWRSRLLCKNFYDLSDGVLVYGDYAKNIMIRDGFKNKRIFPVHNSLDYDKQLEIRKSILPSDIYTDHFKNTNKNFIFIGRLIKAKQLDMILQVLKIFNESGQKYNITYIGSGEDEDRLKQLANDYNLNEQVWFYGACYDEKELSELIYNSDMCISPGDIGLTVMHCLVYGCPVISHNNFSKQGPEFEAIKEGITGDFFEYNNIESLQKVIENWFVASRSREDVRNAAYSEIDTNWTPYYQLKIIREALEI